MIDQLVARISECQTVLDKLDSSDVWAIISKDAKIKIEDIDNRWQFAKDNQLDELRKYKLAFLQILEIKKWYALELEGAQKQMQQLTNRDVSVAKDFDNDFKER